MNAFIPAAALDYGSCARITLLAKLFRVTFHVSTIAINRFSERLDRRTAETLRPVIHHSSSLSLSVVAFDSFTASRWVQQLWNCDFLVTALHLQGIWIRCGHTTKEKG